MDYANDPELNGKYLGTITKDFATVSDTLMEASSQIRKRDISKYPVFVFARQEVPLGGLLVNADELGLEWHVFASYLELFVQQRVIAPENVEAFQQTYKDPNEFCCLFVLDEEVHQLRVYPLPRGLI